MYRRRDRSHYASPEHYDALVEWSIENFSFCPQKCGHFLQSPYFRSFSRQGAELWFLRLYPRGTINNEQDISCFLCRHEVDDGSFALQTDYSIQILSTDGGILLEKNDSFSYKRGFISGFDRLVKRNDITQNYVFLPQDTLKIRLILGGIRNHSYPSAYRFFTIIDVEKYSFIWELKENISNTKEITFFGKHKFVMTRYITDKVLKLSTEAIFVKRFTGVVKCKLSLLKPKESERLLKESESFYDGINDVVPNSYELTLSPPKRMNTARKSKILDGPQLTSLRCKLAFSHVECEEEGVVAHYHGCTAPPPKRNVSPIQTSDNHDLFQDFLLMYTSGKMTDVTLRVDGQTIQAHKFVLSARSPVFSAMFEKDMLENQTGIVDIKDLDAETSKYFLLYLYGGPLQELTKETAKKLILVADRYLVTSLKAICSSFLESNMTEETVCETLFLADMINDENLKKASIDFFVSHAKVILESLEWKQFQDNHSKLATEALMKFAMEACSKSSI